MSWMLDVALVVEQLPPLTSPLLAARTAIDTNPLKRPCCSFSPRASASAVAQLLAEDDDQKRNGRRLLLGKGAIVAHRLAHPLAAELDECAGTAPAP
jgi:hypothetical protein